MFRSIFSLLEGKAAAAAWNDWALVSQSPLPTLVLWVLAAALLGAWLLSLRAYLRAGRRYAWLAILGLCSALLAFFLLLQPALDLRSVTHSPGRLAVLIDDSNSMQQPFSGEANETRFAAVERFFRDHDSELKTWQAAHSVEFYTLSGGGPANVLLASRGGDKTSLVAGLEGVLKTHSAVRPLAAVVLFSDGADSEAFGQASTRASQEALLAPLGTSKVPVSTVSVGQPKGIDLAIASVEHDALFFVRNTAKVDVSLSLRSSADQPLSVPVTLYRDEQVVGQALASVRPAQKTEQKTVVHFEFVPDEVGDFVFRVAVPVQPGESIVSNNENTFVGKVVRDKIRVLLVSGGPSWDERFLRQYLKSSPNVDLISFFILRTPEDAQLERAPTDELSLIPFPTNELFGSELHTFDVVMLQNFDYRPYQMGYLLENLRAHVRQGGALVMWGGAHSFGGGAYAATPLADVLPVVMSDDRIAHDEFVPALTQAGERHPVLRQIAKKSNAANARAEAFAPLGSVNYTDGLAPGAVALLAHPTLKGKDGQPLPLVAVRQVEKGRSMALMSDNFWQWSFRDKFTGGTGAAYERLLEQTMRWLMRDPEASRLRLLADHERVRPGDKVTLSARVLGNDYQPLPGASVTFVVTSPGSAATETPLVTGPDGQATLPLVVLRPGVSRVVARLTEPDLEKLEATVLIDATVESAESAALLPRPELLAQIASELGGTQQDLPNTSLEKVRLSRAETQTIGRHQAVPLWQSWPVLLLLVASLSAEWLLRRRWGFT